MNDPQFVEASRILAEKMMKATPSRLSRDRSVLGNKITKNGQNSLILQRLDYGFQALTSRKARPAEMLELISLFEKQKKHFTENPESAEKLLTVGEFKRDKYLDKSELAAYTIVASMIMNFDEFAVKR